MHKLKFLLKPVLDIFVTLVCWIYYTFGFIILFAPLYIYSSFFKTNIEFAYQRLNCRFYRTFFYLLSSITPNFKIQFLGNIEDIRSSVIVCNHISYLDPLLLISAYDKHKTIVKDKFFKIPIFGAVLKRSGYIPSTSKGKLSYLTIYQMENLHDFFAEGGNLFVFPEGTRSKQNIEPSFYSGAFKIAKRYNVPIQVLHIQNTDIFFPPGRLLFNTCLVDSISVELLETIHPDLSSKDSSVSDLMDQVQRLLTSRSPYSKGS